MVRGAAVAIGFAMLLLPAAALHASPTPSGVIVYAARDPQTNAFDLFQVRLDGARGPRLTHSVADDVQPTFSPDGRMIAFTRGVPGLYDPTNSESRPDPTDIWVMRSDGTGPRRLARGGHWPAWSPDGSRIAFATSDGGIAIVRVGDGRSRRVVPRRCAGCRFEYGVQGLDWSPRGGLLAYWKLHGDIRVYRDDRAAPVPSWLPSGSDDPVLGALLTQPTWEPHGQALALLLFRPCRGTTCSSSTLATLGPSGLVPLTDGGSPAWSPEGDAIAFLRTDSQRASIYVRSLVDGGERRLVRMWALDAPAVVPRVSWQPRCSVTGTDGGERLGGSSEDDLLCGLGGDDTLTGGFGEDKLFGEDGDDTFLARDSEFDVVGCGPGRDRVTADAKDLVGVDCEVVRRR